MTVVAVWLRGLEPFHQQLANAVGQSQHRAQSSMQGEKLLPIHDLSLLLRRNDEIGCDPDLTLPAQNMEQNALAVLGAHAGV
jgi:hypothetical protein